MADAGEHHHHHHHHHYYRDAGRLDQPSPNPHKLRRSLRHRMVAGVCGGIAEYFGWPLWKVRVLTLVALVLFFPVTVFLYFMAMLFMKSEEPARGLSRRDEEFWRSVSTKPKVTMNMFKHRFRAIDGRIAEMERAVTSEEFRLHRAFRDLEQTPPDAARPT